MTRHVELVLRSTGPIDSPVGPLLRPSDAAPLFVGAIGDKAQEHFYVIGLDAELKPVVTSTVNIGTPMMSVIDVGSCAKILLLANATAAVVAHNHPSGTTRPSPDDLRSTDNLKRVLGILGIDLLDSFVIGNDGSWYAIVGGSSGHVDRKSATSEPTP